MKDCTGFVVKNTRCESYGLVKPPTVDPGADARFRPWWETWTMIGDGHTVDGPLDFVPDDKGTQIIQLAGVIEK